MPGRVLRKQRSYPRTPSAVNRLPPCFESLTTIRRCNLFAYNTRARLGDCANLRWSSLDLDNDIAVFTERKTRAKATIRLHPDFRSWLNQQPSPIQERAAGVPCVGGEIVKRRKRTLQHFRQAHSRSWNRETFVATWQHPQRPFCTCAFLPQFSGTLQASSVFNQATLKEITRRVTNHAGGGVVDRTSTKTWKRSGRPSTSFRQCLDDSRGERKLDEWYGIYGVSGEEA
jgi:hypothetical protein